MGVIEKEFKHKRRKKLIQEVILATVKASGFLAISLVAPNILVSIKQLGFLPRGDSVKRSLSRLIDSGQIQINKLGDIKYFSLTKKGERALLLVKSYDREINKPKKWDKRFRIIIFDIKEHNRKRRDKFRLYLKKFGFKPIQQSVWVYPYDCEDVIQLLKTEIGIGKDVIYIVTEHLEGSEKLINQFNL